MPLCLAGAACAPSTSPEGASYAPAHVPLGMTGTWALDGPSFGRHGRPYGHFSCSGTSGSVRTELVVSAENEIRNKQFGHVTVFPHDAKRSVEVETPWAHVTFARSDCSRFAADISVDTSTDRWIGSGTLGISCALGSGEDSVVVDGSFACSLD